MIIAFVLEVILFIIDSLVITNVSRSTSANIGVALAWRTAKAVADIVNGGTITSRYFTPKTCHETHAATGSNCIASACLISNTVASKITNIEATGNDKITIEHPLGLIDCLVETSTTVNGFDKDFIKSCGVYRTSRKIMDGYVYIPENIDDD